MKTQPRATVKGYCYVLKLLEKLGLIDKERSTQLKSKYLGEENKNLTLNFENG